MATRNARDRVIIDIDELTKVSCSPQSQGELWRRIRLPLIHKIQPCMYDKDERVYEPNMVSIGPYHYGDQATIPIQQKKWEYLNYILSLNPEKKLSDYIDALRGLEKNMRSFYADEIKIMSKYDFLKMMLLDGCFILVALRGLEGITINEETKIRMTNNKDELIINIEDEVTQTNANQNKNNIGNNEDPYDVRMSGYLAIDLLLLENQIPFFVVMKIYDIVTCGNCATHLPMKNMVESVEDLIGSHPKGIRKCNQPKEFHHLLHLCHMYFSPGLIEVSSNPSNLRSQLFHRFLHLQKTFFKKSKKVSSFDYDRGILASTQPLAGRHRAVEYQKAGIKFDKREFCSNNPHSLLDIVFRDGEMEIPYMTIDSNTYCFFGNLIAFEQTCPEFGNCVTTYFVFLSQFISMPDDVSLLTKRGIITHQLNSDDEVSNIFAALAKNVIFDFNGDNYLRPLCHAMEAYYESRRSITSIIHGWMLSLRMHN